jgi:beta-glucosidase
VVAEVAVSPRAFEHWDAAAHGFATEPGTFVLEAGRSAGDRRLRAELTVS